MRIGLLPLDERPVNTRYPAMVAAIAGAQVALPPLASLSALRRPADCAALGAWLMAEAPRLDGLIVSLDMLGYGGLIASRTTDEPVAAILARLELLRELRRAHKHLPIYAFSLITRVSNANDAVEEPAYWAEHGEGLYALSQLLDRRRRGQAVDDELARHEAALPAEHRRDMLRRRLRNHSVNLAALGLLEAGVLDLLVLSSDDTSPFGLPSSEKEWLAGWSAHLELIGADASLLSVHRPSSTVYRLLMYPGADEVGCALVARLLNMRHGVVPTVAVRYAPEDAAGNVAAYEDGPISRTVERQILAAGGALSAQPAASSTDFTAFRSIAPHPTLSQGERASGPPRPLGNGLGVRVPSALAASPSVWLGVNAPVARRGEWEPAYAAEERAARPGALEALVAEARSLMDRQGGPLVALADVAYPNGADPALMELMLAGLDLTRLGAYGAWNTAGNTLGTTVAQSFAALLCATPEGRAAHRSLLLHRLLEDWGYQQRVRAEVRGWLRATTGHHDPATPEHAEAARARIEASLGALIAELPGFADCYALAPGSVRLPWGRTFEVDFALLDITRKHPLGGGPP